MGAVVSSTEPNKLAIAAISHIVRFDRSTFEKLAKSLAQDATPNDDGSLGVTRECFDRAIAEARIHPADKEIFDRLFILYDRAGDGVIDAREFAVGASILVKSSPKDKLIFALELYDRDHSGKLSKEDLLQALRWTSKTSSFFGDKPPTEEALSSLVDRVFNKIVDEDPCDTTYCAYVEPILSHPLLEDFISQSDDSPRLQQSPEE